MLGLALAALPAAALADTCPECQARQYNKKHTFGSIKICARCAQAQMAANGGVLPPPGPPMMVTSAPGMSARQACVACQNAGSVMAPGYAVAEGGQFASMDPAPIGVVQTNYQHPASGSAALPPGRAVVGPASNPVASFGSPNMVAPPEPDRPRLLPHLIPWSRRPGRSESRREQARSAHAAIPYGTCAQPVTELPASAVFGR
jgi:hypothetical protein